MAVIWENERFVYDRPWWFGIQQRWKHLPKIFGGRGYLDNVWLAYQSGMRPWPLWCSTAKVPRGWDEIVVTQTPWYTTIDLKQVESKARQMMQLIARKALSADYFWTVSEELIWFLAGARPAMYGFARSQLQWLKLAGDPDLCHALDSMFCAHSSSLLINRRLGGLIIAAHPEIYQPWRCSSVEKTIDRVLSQSVNSGIVRGRLSEKSSKLSLPFSANRYQRDAISLAKELLLGKCPEHLRAIQDRLLPKRTPEYAFVDYLINQAIQSCSDDARIWWSSMGRDFGQIQFKRETEKKYWEEIQAAVEAKAVARTAWVTREMVYAIWKTTHGFVDRSLTYYDIAGVRCYGVTDLVGKTALDRWMSQELDVLGQKIGLQEWVTAVQMNIKDRDK